MGTLWVPQSRIGVGEVGVGGRGMGEGSSKVGGDAVLKELGRSLLAGCGCGENESGSGGDDCGESESGDGSLVGGSGHDDGGGDALVASVAVGATDAGTAAAAAAGQGIAAVAAGYTPTGHASSPPPHSQHPLRPYS